MKVLRLQMQGLRSHRTETTIDLVDRDLVALVGPTGAGKSSILEGLCFALFGESTSGGSGRGGSALGDLSSDGRTPIVVRLEISVGGVRYQLTRSVAPPAGKSTSWSTKECWVHQMDADGRTVKSWEQATKVKEQVRRLLGGLTREQFCQSVMLPQNRFAALIEAPPDERNKLLDNLLGLTALRKASTTVRDRVKVVDHQVDLLRIERDGLDPDPRAAAAAAYERSEVHQSVHDAAAQAATALAGLAAQHAELRTAADRFDRLAIVPTSSGPAGEVAGRLAERFAELASEAEALQEAEGLAIANAAEAAEVAATSAKALVAVETERGAAVDHAQTEAAPVAFAVAQNDLPRLRSDIAAAELELEGAERRAKVQRASASRVAIDEEQAATAATKAEEAAQQAEILLAEQRRLHEAAIDAATRALASDLAATRAALAAGVAASSAKAAEDQALHTAGALVATKERLATAQQLAAAAAAASGCDPGDACPICDRELPVGWEPPADIGLAAAVDAMSMADRDEREATKALAAIKGEAERAKMSAETLQGAASDAVDATRKAAAAAGLVPPELDAAAVARWERAAIDLLVADGHDADCIRAAATEATKSAAALTSRAREAAGAAVDAEKDLAKAQVHVEAARNALVGAERRRDESQERVLPRWRSLLGEGVDAAVDALARDKVALEFATGVAADAKGIAAHTADVARDAQLAIGQQVGRPAAKALDELVGLTAVIADIGADLREPIGTTWDVPAPDGPIDAGVLVTAGLVAAAVELTASGLALAAAAKAVAASDGADAAFSRGAELVRAVAVSVAARQNDDGGHDYFERLTAATEAPLTNTTISVFSEIVGQAKESAQQARRDQMRFLDQESRASEIDERLAGLRQWRADLHGAVDILDKGAFPAYARRIRTAELAQVASDHLGSMSADRYRFEDDLRVRDGHTGAVRSASTLSGGEKFQASLSLALAVAEIAGRAGVKLETLFLDEGFSGLDSRSLHLALDAIDAEVTAGRSIVLITHIGAVAQRVEDVFLVEPDGVGGCRTSWLDDAQRYELGADLDLMS